MIALGGLPGAVHVHGEGRFPATGCAPKTFLTHGVMPLKLEENNHD